MSRNTEKIVVLALCILIGNLVPISFAAAGPVGNNPNGKFADRNSSEAKASLGRDFLGMLYHDRMDMHVQGLRHDRRYTKVVDLYNKGQYGAGLTAFRDYFLAKLRNPQAYGLTTADVSPYSEGITGLGAWTGPQLNPNQSRTRAVAAADQLMQGVMRLGGKDVKIGEPGQVNWNQPLKAGEQPRGGKTPEKKLHVATGFRVLVQAWLNTGNDTYLERWFAYLDDWALNSDYLGSIHPCRVPSTDKEYDTIGFIRTLGAIARSPDSNDLIPPATLARVLRKHLHVGPMPAIAYMRSNTHNWTPGMGLFLKALLLDEFKVAADWFREARRRNIEDNAVTQNLRDGSENQQDPWYNDNYLQVYQALRLLEARSNVNRWQERSWVSEIRTNPLWRQTVQEHLNRRVRYFLLNRTPQNEWPIPWRGGDKRAATGIPPECRYGTMPAMAPEPYSGGETLELYRAITERNSGIRPSITANWFPYGGYNTVYEGWDRDSGYGALFCSPRPGAYGGLRSRSNNNTFGLAAFGQDMLVDDTVGHYMHPSSPIKVDGQNQFFHAGIYSVPPPAAHKKTLVSAWTDPAPWRWHDSRNFNLMEGVYDGPWSNPNGARQGNQPETDKNNLPGTLRLDQTIRGVSHQRLVHYVRNAGVWIVTDRMKADDAAGEKRKYEQVWRLPLKPSDFHAFKDDEIKVRTDQRRIVTNSDSKTKGRPQANISLSQFSLNDLEYSEKVVPNNLKNRYMVYGRKEISVNWTGTGATQVVTLAVPRAPGVDDGEVIENIEQLTPGGEACGFKATLADDSQLMYLAAPAGNNMLELGPVAARAESLLIVQRGRGTSAADEREIRGIVLGCTGMTINGESVAVSHPDFEFTFNKADDKDEETAPATRYSLLATPIHRPISPVEIGPDRTAFAESMEVTMTSKTPDVEIRYTLDGSEPTPHSPLYDGPFRLKSAAVVKARAYRPGVSENPAVLSGTHATVVSKASFKRRPLQAAVKANATTPGLGCRYYEGPWWKLWMFLDDMKPLRTAGASSVFDLDIIPDDNPPVSNGVTPREKYYALEYHGYLEIPEDGVYTLHAPREFVYPDTDAGYELRVFLGERRVPWGARTERYGLNEWYPATSLHAFGTWSIALEKGLHPFRVVWVDYRTTAAEGLNRPGIRDYIWSGVTPELKISGPGMEPQPIPAGWQLH